MSDKKEPASARRDRKVYQIVTKIPSGKVSTYLAVAKLAGLKNPRQAGFYLHQNQDPAKIPCHRVVRADGRIADGYAFGGRPAQIKKLEDEGVEIKNERVELKEYLWKG